MNESTISCKLIDVIDQRNKASHWKGCCYDSQRYYNQIELWFGIPSVVLSVIILGFAFYPVGGSHIPLWAQLSLSISAVLQGVCIGVQLYIKPSEAASRYKHTGNALGSLGRKLAAIQLRLESGEDVPHVEISAIRLEHDYISRESLTIPKKILKTRGKPKRNPGSLSFPEPSQEEKT